MSATLPQGVKWSDADLLHAYMAGAESGRKHQPTDHQIARAADAYVKLCHITRGAATPIRETIEACAGCGHDAPAMGFPYTTSCSHRYARTGRRCGCSNHRLVSPLPPHDTPRGAP